jgi:hypothetical protein
MTAPAAAVKRRFIASGAAGQGNGSWVFTPGSEREQESVFALSAGGTGAIQPPRNRTDPLRAGCMIDRQFPASTGPLDAPRLAASPRSRALHFTLTG